MRRRLARALFLTVAVGCFLVALAGVAAADNCSSLYDCWGTAGAAGTAAAGAAAAAAAAAGGLDKPPVRSSDRDEDDEDEEDQCQVERAAVESADAQLAAARNLLQGWQSYAMGLQQQIVQQALMAREAGLAAMAEAGMAGTTGQLSASMASLDQLATGAQPMVGASIFDTAGGGMSSFDVMNAAFGLSSAQTAALQAMTGGSPQPMTQIYLIQVQQLQMTMAQGQSTQETLRQAQEQVDEAEDERADAQQNLDDCLAGSA